MKKVNVIGMLLMLLSVALGIIYLDWKVVLFVFAMITGNNLERK